MKKVIPFLVLCALVLGTPLVGHGTTSGPIEIYQCPKKTGVIKLRTWASETQWARLPGGSYHATGTNPGGRGRCQGGSYSVF